MDFLVGISLYGHVVDDLLDDAILVYHIGLDDVPGTFGTVMPPPQQSK